MRHTRLIGDLRPDDAEATTESTQDLSDDELGRVGVVAGCRVVFDALAAGNQV